MWDVDEWHEDDIVMKHHVQDWLKRFQLEIFETTSTHETYKTRSKTCLIHLHNLKLFYIIWI